jgi:hypothetical protein
VIGSTLRRLGLLQRVSRLWKGDIDAATRPLRRDLHGLLQQIETLQKTLDEKASEMTQAIRRTDRFVLTATLNEQHRALIAELPRLLDEERIARHARAAIARAPLVHAPFAHVVIEDVLPQDAYDLLIKAIPPVVFFNDRDPIKQNLRFPIPFGPTLTDRVWGFFDDVIARRVIRPAVLERFHEPLQGHFDSVFGPVLRERANQLPQSVTGGRLMLRRPGYHLAPHRDPKHALLTCLLYLARPGDSETYGTQIFRVTGDGDAAYKQTYYPEAEGSTAELVKVVPFKANSMLVFLNSRGAHGATIPADAPADLERYSYQFYVAPEKEALKALIRELPAELRAMWQDKRAREPVSAGRMPVEEYDVDDGGKSE